MQMNDPSLDSKRRPGWTRPKSFAMRNIKIQARLILLFLVLSFLPMVITGFFAYIQSGKAIEQKIKTYSFQVVNQIARNIHVEMTKLENDTIEIGYSDIVQMTLDRFDHLSDWQLIEAKHAIRKTLINKFTLLDHVSDVILFSQKGGRLTVYGDEGYRLVFKEAFQAELLQAIKDRNGLSVWKASDRSDETHLVDRLLGHENGLVVGKAIKSLYEGEYIGAVVIRTKEKLFSAIYEGIDLGPGTDILMMDGDGLVVSSRSDTIPFNQKYFEQALIDQMRHVEKEGRDVFSATIKHQPHLITFAPIENAGWYVVSVIPYEYLNLESGKIRNQIILLGAGCFLLAIILSFIFTQSIAGPLHRLIKAMNQVKQGNLAVDIDDAHQDEIAEVTRNFNTMVQEIRKLLKDIQQQETQKRDVQFKALQAQINPHFLANILNTAKLLAGAQKAKNLESLLASLIQLLQVSMGKEDDFITVRKEIDYLRNYLNLQEFRYYNKFLVNLEIEAAILDNRLPKFLLQPILENAIIHGIGLKKGQGIIGVKGFTDGRKMIFAITDDGMGMTRDEIRRVLGEAEESENHFCGIGIKNVQERIRLYFGEEYGLHIESSPNYFTTVEIILPLLRGDAEDA